jgi:hypothetical protein
VDDTSTSIDKAKEALGNEAAASGNATTSTKKLGDAAQIAAGDLGKQESAAKKLEDTLNSLNGVNIDAAQAAIRYHGSLSDLSDAVKKNGHGLDITTEKGRAVKQAVLEAADAAMAHAKAVAQQQNSVAAGNVVLAQDVEALKKTMHAAGFTETQIKALTAAYAEVPATAQTVVTDPGALQTIKDLQEVKRKAEGIPPGESVTVEALTADAEQDLTTIGWQVKRLPDGKIKVTAPVDDVRADANRIQNIIDGITGRTVHVRIDGSVSIPGTHSLMSKFADGGIRYYAQGGVRHFAGGSERHVAQIAPAGSWRVWGEPETGGEAYIPLGAAKRGRSTEILSDVAARFGYQLVPVAQLAPGGGGGSSYDQSRSNTVNLYGAKQSSAEQVADLMRHLEQVS